jgi:hypothetical protein
MYENSLNVPLTRLTKFNIRALKELFYVFVRCVAGSNEPNYQEYMECLGSLGSDDSHKQRPIQLLNLSTLHRL